MNYINKISYEIWINLAYMNKKKVFMNMATFDQP